MEVSLCLLFARLNCCCAIDEATSREGGSRSSFPRRGWGSAAFLIWLCWNPPKHSGISLDTLAGWLQTLHGCFSLCFLSAQLPYLLLNSTGTDPKNRMHPVFFGESIKVNPKPEQEIK